MNFNVTTIRSAYSGDQAASCVVLCERWLQDHPDDLGVICDYASMLYQMARYDDAVHIYNNAIQRFEDERWALHNQLGHLFQYRGDLSEAERCYQKAIDEDPEEDISYIFVSEVRARQGRLREAEEIIRQAIRCPDYNVIEVYHNLGMVLRGQARLHESGEAFRTVLETDNTDRHARELLSDVESAIAASDISPEAIESAGNREEAATCIALAERWLQENRGGRRVLHSYAKMLSHVWRYDDAIRVHHHAIDRFNIRWVFYQGLGDLNRRRGNFRESELWYHQAIDDNSDEAGNLISLGAVQARGGNLRKAEETHRRATRCSEGSIDEAYHNLGLVLRGQDRLDEAAECFRKAIEIDTKYENAIEALNDVEVALKLRKMSSA